MNDPTLTAALDLWETLAARAWQYASTEGRGMLIVSRDDLLAASDDTDAENLATTWFRLDHMPPKDDYSRLVETYDPEHQIVLLVGESDADEMLYVIDCRNGDRVPPPQASSTSAS